MIDSHAHIGEFHHWAFTIDDLYQEMQKYGISHAIISNISGNEFDYEHQKLNDCSSLEINENTLKMLTPYSNVFRMLAWIRPYSEADTILLEDFIQKNRDMVVGLKVHPFTAQVRLDDSRYNPYIQLCQKYSLPFCIHTEEDGYSNVSLCAALAKQHPTVRFVMVHLGLRTDHTEALRYMRDIPNLYGDTTIVDADTVMEVLSSPCADRILFGSDAPTLGPDTYERYVPMYEQMKESFDTATVDKLYKNNCVRLFGLEDSWIVN